MFGFTWIYEIYIDIPVRVGVYRSVFHTITYAGTLRPTPRPGTVSTRIIVCSVGGPELNLHLPLLPGGV